MPNYSFVPNGQHLENEVSQLIFLCVVRLSTHEESTVKHRFVDDFNLSEKKIIVELHSRSISSLRKVTRIQFTHITYSIFRVYLIFVHCTLSTIESRWVNLLEIYSSNRRDIVMICEVLCIQYKEWVPLKEWKRFDLIFLFVRSFVPSWYKR